MHGALTREVRSSLHEGVPHPRARQRDPGGGTHVRSTAEVGRIHVTNLENKGKGNKRVRLEVVDA